MKTLFRILFLALIAGPLIFGSCNNSPAPSTPGTTTIDTSGVRIDIDTVLRGVLLCRRTVLYDTTVVSVDSVGIEAVPRLRFESCWRDSQGGQFFYRTYKDSLIFPQDYLDLTLLKDSNEVYFLKGIYAQHRWSDTADFDFNRFPSGCLCGSDTAWHRDKVFSFGFKRRNGVYNWKWMIAVRQSVGDTLMNWGTYQTTIDEIIAGRRAFHAQCATCVDSDPWATDTATYYHMLLQYPQW